MGDRWWRGWRWMFPLWMFLLMMGLACGGTWSEPSQRREGLCEPRTCAEQGLDCGVTIDGCGGVLRCGSCAEAETCGGGGRPNVCARAPCAPATCEALGAQCGELPDGCGGALRCGTCTPPETCGGGGVAHVCGQPRCTPITCAAMGKECGTLSDGCGGTLECGACAAGQTCGGGGSPNMCGTAPCTPTTCEALGKNCGTLSDGCGGSLACGECTGGATCGGGGVPHTCGQPPCVPHTCSERGQDCGLLPDGCGGPLLSCGTCAAGDTCGGGSAPDTCGPASCMPTTCAAQGKNCGQISNGCGGLIDCGTCYAGQTCGGGGAPNVCGSPNCLPTTCEELGKTCGEVPDGCGKLLPCGNCAAGETCGGGATPNVCAVAGCRPTTCGLLGKTCGEVPDGCGGRLQCGECAAGETCGGGEGGAHVCEQTASVCVDQDLGSTLPVRLKGTTLHARDDHQASCGGQGAPDRGFLWTAPHAGTYGVDTARSAMRTLVSVRDGGCGGPELACATGGLSSGGGARASVRLAAGQRVLVVVDAPGGGDFGAGDFELHLYEETASEAGNCFDGADNDGDRWVDCADTDCQGEPLCDGRGCADVNLGSALPVTYLGDTVHSLDSFQGTCGEGLQQDRGHLWTAPRDGTFVFDTAGSEGNALYVLTGCRGQELGCASARTATRSGVPHVKLTLEKGRTVLVVVDGMARSDLGTPIRYSLHISDYVAHEAGRCANGADDDADGLVDEADPDCR